MRFPIKLLCISALILCLMLATTGVSQGQEKCNKVTRRVDLLLEAATGVPCSTAAVTSPPAAPQAERGETQWLPEGVRELGNRVIKKLTSVRDPISKTNPETASRDNFYSHASIPELYTERVDYDGINRCVLRNAFEFVIEYDKLKKASGNKNPNDLNNLEVFAIGYLYANFKIEDCYAEQESYYYSLLIDEHFNKYYNTPSDRTDKKDDDGVSQDKEKKQAEISKPKEKDIKADMLNKKKKFAKKHFPRNEPSSCRKRLDRMRGGGPSGGYSCRNPEVIHVK